MQLTYWLQVTPFVHEFAVTDVTDGSLIFKVLVDCTCITITYILDKWAASGRKSILWLLPVGE